MTKDEFEKLLKQKMETEKDKVRKQEIEKLRSEMTEGSYIHYFQNFEVYKI